MFDFEQFELSTRRVETHLMVGGNVASKRHRMFLINLNFLRCFLIYEEFLKRQCNISNNFTIT